MREKLFDSLMTRKECAEMLNVSVSTVRKFERNGKIPRVELPGIGIRYRPESIQAFIEGREIFRCPER